MLHGFPSHEVMQCPEEERPAARNCCGWGDCFPLNVPEGVCALASRNRMVLSTHLYLVMCSYFFSQAISLQVQCSRTCQPLSEPCGRDSEEGERQRRGYQPYGHSWWNVPVVGSKEETSGDDRANVAMTILYPELRGCCKSTR